jgi:hypothetical protein
VKLRHKINFGWERPSEPINDSYQTEIDTTLRKAEKAWRKAQQAAERAELLAAKRLDPESIALRDKARRLVLQRLNELREIEELMRQTNYRQIEAVHRTGRQDRLEVGKHAKPKGAKRKPSKVTRRHK